MPELGLGRPGEREKPASDSANDHITSFGNIGKEAAKYSSKDWTDSQIAPST